MGKRADNPSKALIGAVMGKVRPNQAIGFRPLMSITGLNKSSLLRVLRFLRRAGLATMKTRYNHVDGALVTFYKEALPKADRDHVKNYVCSPGTRVVAPKGAVSTSADDVFAVNTSTTFTIVGGVYTAKQLKKLAHAVLRELEAKA